MSESKLKPCPFCGRNCAEFERKEGDGNMGIPQIRVVCGNCLATTTWTNEKDLAQMYPERFTPMFPDHYTPTNGEENAAKHWNKRTAPEELEYTYMGDKYRKDKLYSALDELYDVMGEFNKPADKELWKESVWEKVKSMQLSDKLIDAYAELTLDIARCEENK